MRTIVEYQTHIHEGSGKLTFLLSDASVLEVDTHKLMGTNYWNRVRTMLYETYAVTDPNRVLPVID